MSYTIRYTQKTREEKERAALEDVRNWLSSSERFEHVESVLRKVWASTGRRPVRISGMRLALEFAGVRGLPARAMIRRG